MKKAGVKLGLTDAKGFGFISRQNGEDVSRTTWAINSATVFKSLQARARLFSSNAVVKGGKASDVQPL